MNFGKWTVWTALVIDGLLFWFLGWLLSNWAHAGVAICLGRVLYCEAEQELEQVYWDSGNGADLLQIMWGFLYLGLGFWLAA